IRVLFGECTGTLLVEVRKQDKEKFLALFEGLPLGRIGTVTEEKNLSAVLHGASVLDIPLSDLITSWNGTL
ncbi:MAG TPA: AIR synthase-related protein, partial [Anaerolineales bacterium]|nr:AIR synthase-related protein [Anaerolineales bacterium]